MFNEIFVKNNVQYYFFVMDAQKKILIEQGIKCPGTRTSATQPLPSRAGDLIIGVDICD